MRRIISALVIVLLTGSALNAQTLEQGIKMYNYERYKSAVKELEPLSASNPIANYYLGLTELALGNVDKAQGIFAKYPENYANMSGMARVQFMKGNVVEGMRLVNELESKGRKKDWEPARYAADAIIYTKGGDAQQAIDWYVVVLEKNETPEMLMSSGDAYLLLPTGGGKAMTSYEKAVAMDAANSLVYSKIGKLWYNAKNYDSALSNWERAKVADPANPLPYRDLANAYTYVGNYKLALENLEEYLKRSDKTDADMIQYVNTLYQAKSCDKAIKTIDELKARGVFKPNFYGIKAYCYMENKDSISAVKALENARLYFGSQDPAKLYPMDYLYYGRIMMNNDMSDSADYYFTKSLSMDTSTNKLATYREIGAAFKDNRSWVPAAEWYKKAINDYPDDVTATDYFWSGVSYYYGNDYTAADAVFNDMITKFPDQPSGLYWRARTNAAIDNEGKTGGAEQIYLDWLKVADEREDYSPKDNDLMYAYQYLALYYYNTEQKDNAREYVDKILAIDAENKLGNQILDILNNQQ